MSSNRIGRINEEIQRELANLLRTVKDPRLQGGLVTITHVDTTNDLRYAKIYISALNKNDEKDMMKGLKSASGYLRRELGALLPDRGGGPCGQRHPGVSEPIRGVLFGELCRKSNLSDL